MSILLDRSTRVCVVGISGGRARADLVMNVAYGTRVVCGVAPGRGGTEIEGVPVFDTAREAMDAVPYDAVSVYVPPRAYRMAMLDAIAAGPRWIHVVTEGVPLHDNVAVRTAAAGAGVMVIGPNTNGLITPGEAKVGFIAHAPWIITPGRVGVLSRSGGFAHDICFSIGAAGFGVSTAVAIGGDAVVGQGFADLLALFEDDDDTDAVFIFGEAGPPMELEVARLRREGLLAKPLVAMICGDFLDWFASGATFGHAGAFLNGDESRAATKRAALAESGAIVIENLHEIPAALARATSPTRAGRAG